MTGKQIVIAELIKRMEKSTVGTFPAIWEVFCKVTNNNDPKVFEKYNQKYTNMR